MSQTPQAPPTIEPETKDWTHVLDGGCPECGFDAAGVSPATVGARLRTTIPRWEAVLARGSVRDRPAAWVWSPLEYGCHVRDTCRIFGQRLVLLLDEDDPEFDNWDQDATAVAERYWEQDPVAVAAGYREHATATATLFDSVQPQQYRRSGRRSNGSAFTVDSLGSYFLHDIEHHLGDVSG